MTARQQRQLTVSLYLLAGLPLGVFSEALPACMRLHGRSLTQIGLLGILQLPWSLKFLLGPCVDRLGSPRWWLWGSIAALCISLAGLASLGLDGTGTGLWGLLLLLTCGSAIYDVTLDAVFLRSLHADNRQCHAGANGLRLVACKAAMMVGGGGVVVCASLVGWTASFLAVAALVVLCTAATPWRALRPQARGPHAAVPWPEFWRALRTWLLRPTSVRVFIFIFVYKAGVASLMAMDKVFWVDCGVPASTIGAASIVLGTVGTVLGAVVGTQLVARWGLTRALWIGSCMQALAALCFFVASTMGHGPTLSMLWLASGSGNLALGLSTTALMNLVTASCEAEQAATHFSWLTASYALSRVFCSTGSALLVYLAGYGLFYVYTGCLVLAGMATLAWLYHHEKKGVLFAEARMPP